MQRVRPLIILIFTLLLCATKAYSQLTAPGRNWSGVTSYTITGKPDSIFTFYANQGALKCRHTTGSVSTFVWYKYNPNISNVANRFELIQTVTGGVESEVDGLREGGYRVVVTDDSDSIEVFTAWLFTDDVTLSRIDIDSRCQFLELLAVTSPNSYNVEYDRFVYYNLSRTTNQPEINTFGKTYFKEITWDASESRVEFYQSSSLRQVIEKPAPLYSSSYSVEIRNVFGRVLSANTSLIKGIAAKAIQKVQVKNEDNWSDYASSSKYEALLELRLEGSSVNADSIFWFLLNKGKDDYDDEYSVIWKDSSSVSSRVEAFPPKQLMRPGYFRVKHLAYNTESGCIDSVELDVVVDSSKIKAEAIPNVFSPNGGGGNDMFKFIDPEENLKSIQSFRIKIFSRSGKLIYSYTGNPKEWEGWNGKIDGTGAEAAEGVYFFIIEAKGWDGREFDYGPYKGFLHLYRGK